MPYLTTSIRLGEWTIKPMCRVQFHSAWFFLVQQRINFQLLCSFKVPVIAVLAVLAAAANLSLFTHFSCLVVKDTMKNELAVNTSSPNRALRIRITSPSLTMPEQVYSNDYILPQVACQFVCAISRLNAIRWRLVH